MRTTWCRLFAFSVVLVIGVQVLAAKLQVCPQCGYENKPTRTTCSHCSAGLPVVEERATGEPEGGAERPVSPGKNQFARAVESDIRLAREQALAEDWDVARLILLNASALELLVPAASGGDRAARIAKHLKVCESKRKLVRAVCEDCKGTKLRLMKTTSLDGSETFREVPGTRCPTCRGTGMVTRVGTLNERRFSLGRAIARYKQLRRTLKQEPVGEAWVPAGSADKLDLEQEVLLRKTLAPWCRKCMGFGCEECRTCDGTGRVDCPNRDCVDGKVEVEDDERRLVRAPSVRKAVCKECDGAGTIKCPKCKGAGGLVCRTCNGTGESERCSRCGGEALVTCRRCKGTGHYKDSPCAACGGRKKVLCTACSGDGHK